MTCVLADFALWLNVLGNAAGRILSVPIARLSPWLSNTIIAIPVGVLILVIFKYASNQKAIGRARDRITANILGIRLFKNNIATVLRSQLNVIMLALLTMIYSLLPLLIMTLPLILLLSQMALWYQWQPLQPGERALIVATIDAEPETPLPESEIIAITGAHVVAGPIHIPSKQQIIWQIEARSTGYHEAILRIGQHTTSKEFAVGQWPMRVSVTKPGRHWWHILLNPYEGTVGKSNLLSVSIDYSNRLNGFGGSSSWLLVFFASSFASALLFKPLLGVKI
ncbi:MAG: hypothetical protein JXN60_00815 [Lentisphaerae bacterium]|nr:hypothetical protein [Lentisphaerota bacterium]